jgi:ribosomal-protein-alanine N-acetyltransferase
MDNLLETKRLVLRPFEPSDAEVAFGWFGDPVVMRFSPGGPDTSLEQTRKRLSNYQRHQTAHGFSKWIIIDRGSGLAIGDSGLLVLEDYGWIDLGYRFAQNSWGKGLATEAASAWARAAFERFHMDLLGAFVHPKNLASIRVLEKLRFRPVGQDSIMGMDAILYALGANDAGTSGTS